MIHTVKGFVIVNKAEVDVFLELFCFFDDPVDVGNLINPGKNARSSSAFQVKGFEHFKEREDTCDRACHVQGKIELLTFI